MDHSLLPFFSFFVGILVGLTGIGGASLITPMLIFIFQVPPAYAVSSDVVAATLMKFVGCFQHWQQKTLDIKAVQWLAMGSVPGSLFGVGVLYLVKQSGENNLNHILLSMIGIMILFVTLLALTQLILLTLFPQLKLPDLPKLDLETKVGQFLAMSLGAFLGCLVGLTSVSSGSVFALVLISFFRLDAHKLVGTDISQAAILLTFTSFGHLALGTVDWSLVLLIWLGSVPGVLVGAKLCQIAPQRPLQFIIYTILLMVSSKLVYSV